MGHDVQNILQSRTWTIASDCSRLDAFVTGMKVFSGIHKFAFRHLTSCDIAPHARSWIKTVHNPGCLYRDMLDRDWRNGGDGFDEIVGSRKALAQ